MATEALTVKNHPTKAQWDEVNKTLSGRWGSAYFLIDGYAIYASVEQVSRSLKIIVYVNGWLKGSDLWRGRDSELEQMPEIARKFFCLKKTSLHNAKEFKFYEKLYGSKAKAKANGVYDKYCTTGWGFSSSNAFISHIKKHCDSIEIVSYEVYNAALDAKEVGDGN